MLLPRLRGGLDAATASRFWESAFDLLSVAEAEAGGHFLRVNPRWMSVLGYSEDELLGRPFMDFVHEDDRTAALAALNEFTAGRRVTEPFECRLRRADGSTLWTRWTGCYEPETGLLYSVARDITEERETRERLLLVQRLITRGLDAPTVADVLDAVLAEVAGSMGWIYGEAWLADGDRLRQTTAWCGLPAVEPFARRSRSLALGREEGIPGRAWKHGVYRFGPHALGAAAYGRFGWPEGRMFTGGVALPVATASISAVFVFLDSQEIVADDETERVLQAVAEHAATLLDRAEALQEAGASRTLLEAIINAVPASISVKDLEGRFIHVNEAYVAGPGLEISDVIGRRAIDVLDPPAADAAEAGDSEVLGKGRPFQTWRGFDTPDGPRHFQITKFPIHDAEGEVVALGSIAADVTELREGERKMRRLNDELTEQHRELEAFTITLSHDLRAPLRGIAHGAEDALTSPSATKAAAQLERIREDALRLATVLDDLLGYSWASRQPMDTAPTDVGPLVQSVLDRHAEEIAQRGVDIRVGHLPPCLADETLLTLALDNLLTNALKFTRPTPDPRIQITGRRLGDEVVLSVADNGVGLDVDDAADLFEMFSRFHDQDEFEGTGVGLSIVQRTASRHGGRAWVESEEGHGATFFIALPAVDPSEGT